MHQISSLDINFENLESVNIPMNSIGSVFVENCDTVMRRIACNTIAEYTLCGLFVLEVFDTPLLKYSGGWHVENDPAPFEHLAQYRDITSFTVKYVDGEEKEYYVDYSVEEDNCWSSNMNQYNYLSSQGVLYIMISKDKCLRDFFDIDEIENAETIDYAKDIEYNGLRFLYQDRREHFIPARWQYPNAKIDEFIRQSDNKILNKAEEIRKQFEKENHV